MKCFYHAHLADKPQFRTFRRYTDACQWLDSQEPHHAVAGFTNQHIETVTDERGTAEYREVRHARA